MSFPIHPSVETQMFVVFSKSVLQELKLEILFKSLKYFISHLRVFTILLLTAVFVHCAEYCRVFVSTSKKHLKEPAGPVKGTVARAFTQIFFLLNGPVYSKPLIYEDGFYFVEILGFEE